MTPSALIRQLVEAFLAGSIDDGEVGDVERAVRAELAEVEGDPGARAAAAVNLGRRMDRDPTNGPGHARELGVLLKQLGYVVTSPRGDGGVVSTLSAHPSWVAEREQELRSTGACREH